MRKINRRNFMKAMGKTVLLATAAGTLGACGAKIPVRDKEQIKEDVLQKDSTYSRYDHPEMPFTITSYEILNRETSQSEMTDNVTFQMAAENEYFSYEGTYDITYILNEKSWSMGSFDLRESQFTPLRFPTEDDAQEIVEQENRQCISLGQTGGDGLKEFVYSFQCIDQTYPSLRIVSQVDVQFQFGPNDETIWETNVSSEKIGYQFDLAGDWHFKDSDHDIHINVAESPVTLFYDTPTLTINSDKIWFRRKEWNMSQSEERHYERNEPVELSGSIGSPYDIRYSVERDAIDELFWLFELDGESCKVAYDYKQGDFALMYEGNYYQTLSRNNG